jgi:hypothetical protein
MRMDIRIPIGSMFAVLGILLAGYGALGPHDIYGKSLGINVNLGWGIVLLVFGAIMLFLGWRTPSDGKSSTASR